MDKTEYSKCVGYINEFFLTTDYPVWTKYKKAIQKNTSIDKEDLYKYFNILYFDMKFADIKRGIQAIFKAIDLLATTRDKTVSFEVETISKNNFRILDLKCAELTTEGTDPDSLLIDMISTTSIDNIDSNSINGTMYRKDLKQYIKQFFLINNIIVSKMIIKSNDKVSKSTSVYKIFYDCNIGLIWRDEVTLKRQLPTAFTSSDTFTIIYKHNNELPIANKVAKTINDWFERDAVTSIEKSKVRVEHYKKYYKSPMKPGNNVFVLKKNKDGVVMPFGSAEEALHMFKEFPKGFTVPMSRISSTVYDYVAKPKNMLATLNYLYNKHKLISCIPFSNLPFIKDNDTPAIDRMVHIFEMTYDDITDRFDVHSNLVKEIKVCMRENGKRFILILLYITTGDKKEQKYVSHQNIVIYDKEKKSLEIFDPTGYDSKDIEKRMDKLRHHISNFFKSNEIRILEFYEPLDYCPHFQYQAGQAYEKAPLSLQGTCAIWCIWYADLRLSNPDIPRDEVIKYSIASIAKNYNTFTNFILGYSSAMNIYVETVIENEKRVDISQSIRDETFENFMTLVR